MRLFIKIIAVIATTLSLMLWFLLYSSGGRSGWIDPSDLRFFFYFSFPSLVLNMIYLIFSKASNAKSSSNFLKNNLLFLWVKRKTLEEKNKVKELEEKTKAP